MTDNVSNIDTTEALRISVESEKNLLEEMRAELYGASKDVISSYKRYSRSRNRVSVKASVRNLDRLSKAQTELGMFIDGYATARARVQDALASVVKAHDNYLEALYVENTTGAKRAARAMDSYIKRIERFVDKMDESVACISSHYALRICAKEDEIDASGAKNTPHVAQNSAPSASFVHTNEVEVSPVSIDIGPTVERAVERAIAELSDTLDGRIAQTLRSAQPPVSDATDAAIILDAADRIGNAAAMLAQVLTDLDKVITDVTAMADKCRSIVEMQRSAAREMQGIEVKQRLVNQEQTALIEAQEVVLQHQRLITERHAEITEAQKLSADAVKQIAEVQRTIDSSLKESLKSQKALLTSNSKYIEKLNKQVKENENANAEDYTNG